MAPDARHVRLAAIALAVTVAGCGSSQETHSATGAQTKSTPSPARKSTGAKARVQKTSRKDGLRRLSPAQRAKLARAAALAVLAGAGFSRSGVSVAAGGTAVTISLPEAQACSAAAGDETQLASQIRLAAPFVRSVTMSVSGTGQPLSAYVSAHCSAGTLPSGAGRVVYSSSGRGMTTTAAFTVRSKRWTLAYNNDSSFLAVFVLEHGKIKQAASATKRGTGSAVFKGTGTYQLRISGSGRWTVRVRDGA
jgi:hypothetical protein